MIAVFKEVQDLDGAADISTILVHPKSRDIILHTPSYLLVVRIVRKYLGNLRLPSLNLKIKF